MLNPYCPHVFYCFQKARWVGYLALSVYCLSLFLCTGNTKGGSITVPLTFCFTGQDQSVLQIKTKANSKPVKQEVNSIVILPPLVFPALSIVSHCFRALLGVYSRHFTMYGSNNLDPVGIMTLHVLVFVQKANKSQLAQILFKMSMIPMFVEIGYLFLL